MRTRRLTRAELLTEARRLDADSDALELQGHAAHANRRMAAALRSRAKRMAWTVTSVLRLQQMLRAAS